MFSRLMKSGRSEDRYARAKAKKRSHARTVPFMVTQKRNEETKSIWVY